MERPILFNTEMVKAILEGRKTQTRRIAKTIKYFEIKENNQVFARVQTNKFTSFGGGAMSLFLEKFAPYQVRDTLWVRETWAKIEDFKTCANLEIDKNLKYFYKCDDNGVEHSFIDVGVKKWHPSIHMPREAARIFLKVTDVRVERLKDITEIKAIKEGFLSTAKENFRNTWNSIYEKQSYGWNENPWVWVIEFERI